MAVLLAWCLCMAMYYIIQVRAALCRCARPRTLAPRYCCVAVRAISKAYVTEALGFPRAVARHSARIRDSRFEILGVLCHKLACAPELKSGDSVISGWPGERAMGAYQTPFPWAVFDAPLPASSGNDCSREASSQRALLLLRPMFTM